MLEQNKYLIQYLLRNGIIKYEKAVNLLKRCADAEDEQRQDIKLVINELNENISRQLLRIDIRTCEISGDKMCVVINTCIDDMSKALPGLSSAEIEYFEVITEAIMTSAAKWVSSTFCLNVTTKLKNNITKDAAQDKIESWTKNGYFVNEDGRVYLGARSISEFELFFKAQYAPRMTTCQLCTGSVFYGKICANCNDVIHLHCLTRFWKKDKKCPACKASWKEAKGRTYEENEQEADEEDTENLDESMDTD